MDLQEGLVLTVLGALTSALFGPWLGQRVPLHEILVLLLPKDPELEAKDKTASRRQIGAR